MSKRDDVLIADAEPNGAGEHIVILDQHGNRRAASPADLPSGSLLLLPRETSDNEVVRIQRSGYAALRVTTSTTDDLTMEDLLGESEADMAARQAAIDAADAELDEVIDRLSRELQRRHPELFDASGRLREKLVAQKLQERTGGKTLLMDKEYIELTGGDLGPPDSACTDAP